MTITTDRNEEFNAQRLVQIENIAALNGSFEKRVQEGSMRRLTDGRYLVTDGWDKGEIFNDRGQPEHGLSEKVYLNDKPAWHSFANVIPGGLTEGDAVLRAGGGNYLVEKVPAFHEWTGPDGIVKRIEAAGRFHNMRTDTGAFLGAVGSQYVPLQNIAAFDFLSEMMGLGFVCETMGTMFGGAKIFISFELPNPAIISADGVTDSVRQFLVLINTHDGKTPIMAMVTPWRPVCKNTERLAVQDAVTTWKIRHTKNAANRVDEARRAMGQTVQYFAKFVQEESSLIQVPITTDQVDDLISDIWGAPETDAAKRTVTIDTKRRERVQELFGVESERVGRNAYAFERAVTGYADHDAERRPRGDLKGSPLMALGYAIMLDSDADVKNRAHARLMELRTR